MKSSTLVLSFAAIASSASFGQSGADFQGSSGVSSGGYGTVQETPALELRDLMRGERRDATNGNAVPDDFAASLNADLERMKRGEGTAFSTIVHVAATMEDAKRVARKALAHHLTVKVMKVGILFGWAAVPSFMTSEQVSEQIARELCARQNIPFERGKIVVIEQWFQNDKH